jgi:hypothetical protein
MVLARAQNLKILDKFDVQQLLLLLLLLLLLIDPLEQSQVMM